MKPAIYLYQHIPKCGGRSLIRALTTDWLANLHDSPGNFHYPSPERVAEFAKHKLDLSALTTDTLVHGHLVRSGIRPLERYGSFVREGRCRLLTMVREPLEHAISAYYHRKRKGVLPLGTLDEWLDARDNKIARFLLGGQRTLWRSYLDSFFFVGVTERMQLSLDLLAAKTGRPPIEAMHLNATARPEYEISEARAADFRERNQLDYEIHRYALDRLERDHAALAQTTPEQRPPVQKFVLKPVG